jgi:hypothetical protein
MEEAFHPMLLLGDDTSLSSLYTLLEGEEKPCQTGKIVALVMSCASRRPSVLSVANPSSSSS